MEGWKVNKEKDGKVVTPESKDLEIDLLVWNLTFVCIYIKVRENFLPNPTYAQNYLQVNRVGKVPLNYWSWHLIGQNLRGNMSDSKQIEWSSQDFVL